MDNQVQAIIQTEDPEAARRAVEAKTQDLVVGDRCNGCDGEGLVYFANGTKHKVCADCEGTGHFKLIPPGTYKSGTVLVVQGVGAFKINDFGEVKMI